MTDIEIVRKKQKRNFTTVNNDFLQDKAISWKAKGLIVYIMSLPDNWDLNMSDLKNRSKDGKDSLFSGMRELKNAGYCKIINIKRDGKFAGVEYEVADYKAFSQQEKPHAEKPYTGKPHAEKPPLVNTNNNKDLLEVNTKEEESESKILSPTEKESIVLSDINNNTLNLPEKKERKSSAKKKELNFSDSEIKEAFEAAGLRGDFLLWVSETKKYLEWRKAEHGFEYKTTTSLKAHISQLITFSGSDLLKAEQIYQQTYANGWKGIFALKEEQKRFGKPTAQERADETKRNTLQAMQNMRRPIPKTDCDLF